MLVKRTVPSASAIWTPRRSFWSVMPSEYSEYPPSRSQCHTYTATPAQRAPSLARSEDELQFHGDALSRAARVPEAGADVAADDAALLEHIGAVRAVAGVGAGGLARDLSRRRGRGRDELEAVPLTEPPPQAARPNAVALRPSTRGTWRRLSRIATSKLRLGP